MPGPGSSQLPPRRGGRAARRVADPNADDSDLAEHGAERAGLDAICRTADVITLHAPLTPDTRHILDARRIGLE